MPSSSWPKVSADARLDSRKGHKSRKSKRPKAVVVEDPPWENAAVDRHGLFQAFRPFETNAEGAISDMNVYRSPTPTDTPELSMSGSSEPNTNVLEGHEMDFDLDILNDNWQPFGPAEVNGLDDMNNINNAEDDPIETYLTVFDGKHTDLYFSSWDDLVDTSALDKPFTFNTSIYSTASRPAPQIFSGDSSFRMELKQKKLNEPHRDKPPYSEDIPTPGFLTNSSNTSSRYNSVLSGPSSIQSDHAIMADEICRPAGFMEHLLFGSGHRVQESNLLENSPIRNAWSPYKSDSIHLPSVLVEQKPTEPLGTRSRVSRIFKCWVETCQYFNKGFPTLRQRRVHYQQTHLNQMIKCRFAGCRAPFFLREQDRAKHEYRMHSAQEIEESHSKRLVDGNEIAEIDRIFVGHMPQNRLGIERSPIEDTAVASTWPVRSNEPTLQLSQSPATSSHSKFGLIYRPTSMANDVVETPNPSTLPSRISQEATLPSGSPTISGFQRSSSVCSDVSVGFDTDSTWSGEESDWEDDGVDLNELLAHTVQDSKVAVRPLLTPKKLELVNDIMKEFWVIFNQEWSTNMRNCSGTPNSTSSSVSQNKGGTGNKPNKDNGGQKRQRDNDEGDEEFDGDGKRNPKRPRIESPPNVSQEKRKFACPYRKHDSRTYCHRIRCWRPCALTPLETIARVKGHLYRYHRIFQCPRCKVLHTNEDELTKHVLEVKGCEVNERQPVEGITSDIEKQLKSRKKTRRDQPEAERWQEMYRILFPMEEVPSPYFEAIQDNVMRSPESEELTSYEEYSRRELPRLFRDTLEAAIADEAQPIEDRLRSQLVGMIQDCQDRVFSAYRARRSFDSPSSNPVVARSSLGRSRLSSPAEQGMPNITEVVNTGIVEALYKGAPLQTSHPETDLTDAASKRSNRNPPSDSEYLSEPSLLNSDSFSIDSMAASQTLTTDGFQQQQSPKTPPPAAETSTEMPSYLPLSLEETRMQTCETPNIPFPELAMDQSFDTPLEDLDFEKWILSMTA